MKEDIANELLNDPIQTNLKREDFDFEYRGTSYNVQPVADYELWGLVVTKNNINAWFNVFHDENSVNLKDICILWGENLKNGVYLNEEISFKSGEWTCYTKWSGRFQETFHKNELSNNHLLSSDTEIQKIIRDINIGDQVHLKGHLVNYAKSGTEFYRKTSLSREDKGNGACEVFYINDINILEKNNVMWNYIRKWISKVFLGVIILNLLFCFFGEKIKRYKDIVMNCFIKPYS